MMTDSLVGKTYHAPMPRYIRPPASMYPPACRREWLIRLHTIANGQLRVVKECQCCGRRDTRSMIGVRRAAAEFYLTEAEVLALPPTDTAKLDRTYQTTHDFALMREKWFNENYPTRAVWWRWYNEYLNSECWKEKRQLIFERDKHKCTRCGDSADQVHHLSYERAGAEHYEDLTSLCHSCHTIEHWDVQ